MTSGLLFALLTGLTWTAIGVVLSRCAKGSFDLIAYSLLQTFCSGAVALFLFAAPSRLAPSLHLLRLPALILVTGSINALAQYFVRQSMRTAHHAPIWSMMQAAMILPFASGILFFGTHPTPLQVAGFIALLIGIFIPTIAHIHSTHPYLHSWLRPAWIAFLLYGILQTLYLLPSHLPLFQDPAGLRPALACWGNFLGWTLIAHTQHHRPNFSRNAILTAAIMVALHVLGAKSFFLTIDHLSAHHASALAIPLMQGSNIIAFSLYSHLALREKSSRPEILSQILTLLGFLLLAIPF